MAVITQDKITLQSAKAINDKAEAAQTLAGNTNQHFWFSSTGTDTGAHITEVTQEDFTDPQSASYQSGGNLLARSNGIAIRDGMTEMANFSATSIQIGQTSQQNVVVRSEDNQTTSTHTGEILFRKGTDSIGSVIGHVDPTTNRMELESIGIGSGGGSAQVSLSGVVGNQSGIDPLAYVEVVDDYNTIDMTIKADSFKVEQVGVDSFLFNVGMGINYTGQNNVLWEPTSQSASPYLTDTQTITLSEAVSRQLTGIVLVWSRRASGTVYNDSWWYEFIPKWHAMNHGTQGIYMSTPTGFSATVCIKCVYVDDLEITGHASNSATGTGYANNTRVLRAVIGV